MHEEDFGVRLAKLRMEKGVSARDMSLSIGQNPGYVNNIENGKGFPSIAVFFTICDFLDVTPAEFFDDGNRQPKQIRELADNLKKLDKNQLYHINAVVQELVKANV